MLQNARRNISSFLTDANHRQLGKGNSGNLAKDSSEGGNAICNH